MANGYTVEVRVSRYVYRGDRDDKELVAAWTTKQEEDPNRALRDAGAYLLGLKDKVE